MSVGLVKALPRIDGVAGMAMQLHVNGRLKALVVPNDARDPAAPAAIVKRNPAGPVSVPERLCHLNIDATLPRNPMGKPEDWS